MVIWETLMVDDPIVDIPLLANRNLSSSMVLQFVVGFILTSTTVLLPQYVQQLLGYNATNAGLILMPGGLVLMLMMPIAGKLVNKMPPKILMAFGLLMTAGSMFYLTGFNTQVSFEHVVWVRVFQCIGLPLFFIPLNTIAYGNLPPGKNNNASALMNLMRNLGGGIGISIASTLLIRRTQLHQDATRLQGDTFLSAVRSLHEFNRRIHGAKTSSAFIAACRTRRRCSRISTCSKSWASDA